MVNRNLGWVGKLWREQMGSLHYLGKRSTLRSDSFDEFVFLAGDKRGLLAGSSPQLPMLFFIQNPRTILLQLSREGTAINSQRRSRVDLMTVMTFKHEQNITAFYF